ncbi:MAG TPA: hypothetical protein VNA12_04525 [Mycobacteriales bacterium]|nr:hypothetical protein [Mycobacteriales bacterium]
MPVVVTGADTPLGERVLAALVGQGLDLRATVDDRGAVAPLVAAGVKTAVSDLVDTERFGAVVEGAHTVIHLRGVSADRVLDGVDDVLAALPDSGVQRIVTLAGLAGPAATHPALTALDEADVDTVVLRVGVVLAPLADPRAAAPTFDDPDLELAPLWSGDLVAALVAADRLRDLRGHLSVDAVGADVVNAGRLMELLGVRVPTRDRPPDPGWDLVGDRGRAMAEILGVRPRSLSAAVQAALAGL